MSSERCHMSVMFLTSYTFEFKTTGEQTCGFNRHLLQAAKTKKIIKKIVIIVQYTDKTWCRNILPTPHWVNIINKLELVYHDFYHFYGRNACESMIVSTK